MTLAMAGCKLVTQPAVLPTAPAFTPATPSPLPTFTPASTLAPVQPPSPTFTATPIPTEPADTGWKPIQPGLERRVINLFNDKGQRYEYLYILRLEPKYYLFDVAYHPEPQTLDAWQAETGALIVVNGGYFRSDNQGYIPTGLTVVKGKALGASYVGFGGMLAVTRNGPELRSLAQTPYHPGEELQAALQSFPLLVKPGGKLGFPAALEDNQYARRTVIAQDRQGRILFILAPKGFFTLHQLSAYLTASDLDLDIALNLDGGPSSGLLLSNPKEEISMGTLLPIVITVQEKK